ncbi:hypothetical protein EJA70_19365 [Pseudomonas sp. PB103]|uniref:hypothetical protein n=1 Tax=Pseudomonas sp. PB103 TaxID=2494698 RepID=UPI00131E7048|nr:hypothetical protein [Pseudomonas sp. PB103]KAE9642399.1 hypothetical protein EJA70_19365 [Pseudomonas sp. PB103]
MTDYTGLKRLCAALISANEAYLDDSCSLENQERFHAADDALQDALPPEVVLAIIAENELLRESPGMKAIRSLRGDCADLMVECNQLKAENEALRDDLEQNQYNANAWRNREESVWIEVYHSDGDDPFISAVTGQITIEQLTMIQAQIAEYREDYFEKGAGLYVFRCAHYQAHYDNVGMTEPAHWETDFESYSPFEWAEEAEAVSQAVQP